MEEKTKVQKNLLEEDFNQKLPKNILDHLWDIAIDLPRDKNGNITVTAEEWDEY